MAKTLDETLIPNDCGKVLDELVEAQNHAHLLGLMLEIKPAEVEAIQAMYQKPKDRLYQIIFKFLTVQPRPTWRAIVDALKTRTVDLKALANTVEKDHSAATAVGNEQPIATLDERLMVANQAEILEELRPAEHQSYVLGTALNLPRIENTNIHSKYTEQSKRLEHVIKAFLRLDPNPTWRKIVDALRHDELELAEKLKIVHCQPLKQGPLLGNNYSTPSAEKINPMQTPLPEKENAQLTQYLLSQRRPSLFGSVISQDEMIGMFSKLKQLFKSELQKRGIVPGNVVSALHQLRADSKKQIPYLDKESFLSELISQASDNSELLGQLSFNMDYLSCHLLDALIETLILTNLKTEIDVYKSYLSDFLNNVPLTQLPQRKKARLYPNFQEVVARVEWQDDVKLGYVEEFRQKYRTHYNLEEYAMMFAYYVRPTKNLLVTWFVPQSVTKMLQNTGNAPRSILKAFRVNKLEVGGECVYRVEYRAMSVTPKNTPQSSLVSMRRATPTPPPKRPLSKYNCPVMAASVPGAEPLNATSGPGLVTENGPAFPGQQEPLAEAPSTSSGSASVGSADVTRKCSMETSQEDCTSTNQKLTLQFKYHKSSAPRKISGGSATTDGKYAYITPNNSNLVYKVNLGQLEMWIELPLCPHRNSGLVIIDGKLTAVGGFEKSHPTKRLATLQKKKWEEIYPSMKRSCFSPAVVKTSDSRHIVVIGLTSGCNAKMQILQVGCQNWYEVRLDCKSTISRPLATVCGDLLHVIQKDGKGYSCSLQTLPPSDGASGSIPNLTTKHLPSLPAAMANPIAATLHGKLIVFTRDNIHQLVKREWIDIGSKPSFGNISFAVSSKHKVFLIGGQDVEEVTELVSH